MEAGSLSDNAARVVPVAPLTGPGVSTLTDPNTVSSPVTPSFTSVFSSTPTVANGWWSSFWSVDSTSWDGDGFGTTDFVLTLYPTDSTTTDSAGMVNPRPSTTVTGTLSASIPSSTSVAHGSESLTSSGSIVVSALPSNSMSPDASAVAESLSSDKTTTTTLTTRVKTTLYVTNVTTAPRLSATPATSMRSWSGWTIPIHSLSRSWPAWLNSTASQSISTAHKSTADSLSTASSAAPESLPEVTVTVYVTPPLPTRPSTATLIVTVLATSTRTTLDSWTTDSDVALTSGSMTISPISPHTSAVSVASVHTPSSTLLPVRNATISPNVESTLSLRLPSRVFMSTETNGVVYSSSGYKSANTTHYVSLPEPVTTTCVPTTTVTYYNARGSPTQTIPQCETGIGPDVTPGFGSASLHVQVDNTATPHLTTTPSTSPPNASPLPTAPAALPVSPENPAPTRVTTSLDSSLACSLVFGNSTPPGCTLSRAITSHAHGIVPGSETPPSRLWRDGSELEIAERVSSRTTAVNRDRDDRPRRTLVVNRTFLSGSEPVGGQRPSTTLITVPRSS
ncbi:uncharacterized protein Z519_05570 [Cladophialophora bantiana CBS 173.52]|uniref:Uncharacterized protein n=1 Tax=Cladophialophora bantiana (strain ATCC 10958 / CBS 173.52 / CDC B-1940 / NIH 8579) TaxID=1442370 RepID=A0A0D2IBR7_CLAB1|nr:uncharacterized protein Z519_05570 [Cladophialophora bantiana CBS 173.52]KIW94254.1 hypothetical protein Z519_05570 [Cladophialophora bantiana CBS 173.52]